MSARSTPDFVLGRHRGFRERIIALLLTDSQAPGGRDLYTKRPTSEQGPREWDQDNSVLTVTRIQGRNHRGRGGGGRKCAFSLTMTGEGASLPPTTAEIVECWPLLLGARGQRAWEPSSYRADQGKDGTRASWGSLSTWIQPGLKLSFLNFKAIKVALGFSRVELDFFHL